MRTFRRPKWWIVGSLIAAVAVILTVYIQANNQPSGPVAQVAVASENTATAVETIRAQKGGLVRRLAQPGSAHSFESAELFAKVSGFLKAQHVDIGSRVKRGDLLAEIDVPELANDIEAAKASCEQSRAEVKQAEAQIESAIADQKAAEASVAQAKADVERFAAEKDFSKKQFDRISELNDLKGIEDRIVDEKLLQLRSAEASERSAQSAVSTAEQKVTAAKARIALAKANLQVMAAKLQVAETQCDRAEIMASYLKIRSPYDGVVTTRNFHPGAYVRSPDHGGQMSLMAIDRTDKMRVLVRVPERDIPFIQPGDSAAVRFDALPNQQFSCKVSRIAEAEDPATRTMLAELDLENPGGHIHDHMYGRVEVLLEEPEHGVTIPSACLVGEAIDGVAKLFVVENGQAVLRDVVVGRDSGSEMEILSGIKPEELVIVRPPAGLTDGSKVATTEKVSKLESKAHSM